MMNILPPVISAILKRPGLLYQPLYVSPLTDDRILAGELSRAARSMGQNAYLSLAEWEEKGGGAGIVMVAQSDLEDAMNRWVLPGVQFVGWGEGLDKLSPPVKEWVERSGLAIPSTDSELLSQGISQHLPDAIGRILKMETGLNIIVTEEEMDLAVAQETMIRLEALGNTVSMGGGASGMDGVDIDVGPKKILIIRINGSVDIEHARTIMEEGKASSGRVILIMPTSVWSGISEDRGIWEEAISSSQVIRLDIDVVLKEEETLGIWPPLIQILDCLPPLGERSDTATRGWTKWDPKGKIELFRFLQNYTKAGEVVDITVYHHGGWGRIHVRGTEIVEVDLAGDFWTVDKLSEARKNSGWGEEEDCQYDLIVDRLKEIIQWPKAEVVVVGIGSSDALEAGRGIGLSRVLLGLSAWIDEKSRSNVRDLAAIWQQKGNGPSEREKDHPATGLVWNMADGQKTTWQIGRELGLGNEAVLDLVSDLSEGGHLVNQGTGEAQAPPGVYELAVAMLASGLDKEAKTRLEEENKGKKLGEDGLALLGGLVAVFDGAKQAVGLLRRSVESATGEAWVPRRMDLGILQVRAGQKPGRVWKDLQFDIAEHGDVGGSWTNKQYAKWGEIAIRSGDTEAAKQVVEVLRGAGNPTSQALGEKLARQMDGSDESV